MSKIIRSKVTLIILLFLLSCSNSRKISCEQRIVSYQESTQYGTLRSYYVALPFSLKENDDSGKQTEKGEGFIICTAFQLYSLLFKADYTEENFVNYLFAMLVRKDKLLLTQDKFEKVKSYLITTEDGKKYEDIGIHQLVRKYTKDHFITAVLLKNTTDYQGRCILYGFLSKGYVVSIDDESGLIILHNKPT